MELISLARNPVPSGASVAAFQGYDGAPLRYARWEATRSPRRGTVCVFPGRTEFIEKYFEVVADLRRRGFAVTVIDWRGQGASFRALSNSQKGHIASFTEYDRDLVRFMKDIVLPDCPPPYVGFGHSMGANILMRAAVATGTWFDRMVLSAPMIAFADEKVPTDQRLARVAAEVLGLIGFARMFVPGGDGTPEELRQPFEGNPLTSDRERYLRNCAIVEAAPNWALGSPTIGWLRAAYRSCRYLARPDAARRIQVPMLMVTAGNDRIVSTPAVEAVARRIKLAAYVAVEGARHELLMEQDVFRARFWAAFDAYLGVESVAA